MTSTTERQQFAAQNEMSMEFVNWFFDEKKESFGNMWFLMAAALWEGWKGRANREAQPVLYASEETLAYAKEGEKSLVTWSEPMGDAVIPLFTVPKAQTSGVVNLPTEFISDEGVMVRLEQVMAALALVGVKYERRGDACRAAMLNHVGDTNEKAESKCECSSIDYCENCLRGMLAQPVSSGYKLVPVEPTEEMIAAAMNCDDVEFNSDETFCVNFGNIYAAMLAAAPGDENDHDTRR
ncbi:hypothetical protein P9A06_25555 [Serratia marcescens]|uniref:hypothetical protein n=1 Tax=Serratia marcescens TaxID=615 RepID=UPI00320498FB